MGTASICPYCGTGRNSVKSNVLHFKNAVASSDSYCDLIFKVTIGMYIIEILTGVFLFGGNIFSTIFAGPNARALLMLGASSPAALSDNWWAPFTASLLHGGIMHIGFNLFALKIIGPLIEQATTKSFFLLSYILTGASGFVLSAMGGSLSVGASASIYGLLGCGIAISFILGQGKDDPLFRSLVAWLIYGVIFAALIPGIDHLAHLGGLIGGLVMGFIWTKLRAAVWFRGFSEKIALIFVAVTLIGFLNSVIFYFGLFRSVGIL